MCDHSEEKKLTVRRLFQGSSLILISNLIYIGNNYIVAWTGLTATEVALARGGLQVLVFGVICYREKRCEEQADEEKDFEKGMKLMLILTPITLLI